VTPTEALFLRQVADALDTWYGRLVLPPEDLELVRCETKGIT
jgi:hypothetical protein